MLTCPYEVPQFNSKRGIVRKCDMCSDRLAASEAPACVQSCPNEAIAIQIVDKTRTLEDAQGGRFLPGAPSPAITVPTTEYVTKRAFPRNLLPADFYQVRAGHPHLPLVFMLVLTQLSVGAFAVEFLLRRLFPQLASARAYHAIVALAAGLLALGRQHVPPGAAEVRVPRLHRPAHVVAVARDPRVRRVRGRGGGVRGVRLERAAAGGAAPAAVAGLAGDARARATRSGRWWSASGLAGVAAR